MVSNPTQPPPSTDIEPGKQGWGWAGLSVAEQDRTLLAALRGSKAIVSASGGNIEANLIALRLVMTMKQLRPEKFDSSLTYLAESEEELREAERALAETSDSNLTIERFRRALMRRDGVVPDGPEPALTEEEAAMRPRPRKPVDEAKEHQINEALNQWRSLSEPFQDIVVESAVRGFAPALNSVELIARRVEPSFMGPLPFGLDMQMVIKREQWEDQVRRYERITLALRHPQNNHGQMRGQ
jgi:hypothetical protein